jgi:hypothetical protein
MSDPTTELDCGACRDDENADQCHDCTACPHRCECPCDDCGMPVRRCSCSAREYVEADRWDW